MTSSFQGVTDLKVKFRLEGFERLQGLGKQLVKIQGIAGKTDKDFLKLFADIKRFAAAGASSESSLRGQISAFQKIRSNLDVTSRSYRQITTEITKLQTELKVADKQIYEGTKTRSDAQRANEGFSKTWEKLTKQLSGATGAMNKLEITDRKFIDLLANKTAKQEAYNRALERQNSIAKNLAATSKVNAITGGAFFGPNAGLTKDEIKARDAAGGQKLTWWERNEPPLSVGSRTRLVQSLEAELQELTIGSKEYERVSSLITLSRRHLAHELRKERVPASGPYELIDPAGRGKKSSLYQQITDLSMTPVNTQWVDRMGNSWTKTAAAIKKAAREGGNSVQSLEKQRTLWSNLRSQLDPASKAFGVVTHRINRLDRALQKATGSGGRFQGTLSAMGGLLTAGLFGGPAGLVGGLGALGVGRMRGLEGPALAATIGSAGLITSQIARPVSQAIGGSATYAADITKSQIALRTATEVKDAQGRVDATESLKSYEQALRAAAFATEELNIPQEVAAKGMTRLSAAVIGAGGNVNNAAEAFINITAAIKGTGGNAEDVKSAITAMVQIFSKGKVSAEELSGQLGERFPAAVTRFAKANKMSTIELQKGLKAGTVGLDMLSRFVESLGEDFLPVARAIAESTEEAGARGTVAINRLRLEFGKVIQPLGAQFQELGVDIVTAIVPSLVTIGKIAGGVFMGIAKVIRLVVDQIGILSKALAAITFGALLSNFTAIGAGFAVLTAQINVLTASIAKQTLVMAKNPLFWVGVAAVGTWEYATRFKRLTDDIEQGLAPISKGERELKKLEEQLSKLEAKRGTPQFDSARTTTTYGGMTSQIEGSGEKEVEKLKGKIERLKAAMKASLEDSSFQLGEKNIMQSLKDDLLGGGEDGKLPIATLFDSLKNGMANVQQVFVNAFNTMSQALTNFAMTGKLNFREMALSIIRDLTQMFIKAAILAPLFKMLGITGGGGGFFGLFNKGKPSAPGGGGGGGGSLGGQFGSAPAGFDASAGFGGGGSLLGDYSGLSATPLTNFGTSGGGGGWWGNVKSWTQPFREGIGNVFKGNPAQAGTLDSHSPWAVDSYNWGVTGQKDPYYGPGGGWNPWRDGQPGQFYNYPLGDQSFLGSFGGEIGQLAHGTHPGSPGQLRGMFSDASMGDFGAQMNLMRHGYTDFYGKGFGGIYPGETTPGLERSLGDFGSGNWGHMNWKTPDTGFTGAGEGYGQFLRQGRPELSGDLDDVMHWMLNAGEKIWGRKEFASGGIIDQPTYALMGEAGSEAVLPLRRGKDGKLGVAAGGGTGGVVINVDVDAKGTKVQGDGNDAGKLGKMIGAAIQAELMRQKRPGGMLSAA